MLRSGLFGGQRSEEIKGCMARADTEGEVTGVTIVTPSLREKRLYLKISYLRLHC